MNYPALKVVPKREESNPFINPEDKRRFQLSENLLNSIAELNKKGVSFSDKMDILLNIQAEVLPLLMEELSASDPNIDRSVIASRMGSFLKEMGNLIVRKREVEAASDDIDPYSPKFQLIFEFFVELVHENMVKQKIDSILIKNFFNEFAAELVGWEDKIIKSLKGVSSKALGKISNPFGKEFKESIKTLDVKLESSKDMYFI
jgi:hypothetical protein